MGQAIKGVLLPKMLDSGAGRIVLPFKSPVEPATLSTISAIIFVGTSLN
jgi:hypothetical protein